MVASSAVAEIQFPDAMNISSAITQVIAQVGKSEYKDIEVVTHGGTLSGTFVRQAGSVLILKRNTNSINLKANKEKIHYILVDINNIVSIAFYTLD
jgi:hypothetical protein